MAMTYEDNKSRKAQAHSLTLNERRRLSLTGVEDVESFDDESILLRTAGGMLEIRGNGLRIETLSTDGGELSVEGKVDSLDYSEAAPNRRGFLSRFLG